MDTLHEYLRTLASDAPAPGGGSAAMVCGAMGCALTAMVARICAGNPKRAGRRGEALDLAERADALRERMLAARAEDEAAFEAVVASRGDKAAVQAALAHAAAVPLRGAELARQALELAREAYGLENAQLASDVGCAAEFAAAALHACAYNVRINHRYMNDEARIAQQRSELEGIEREGDALLAQIRAALR